MAPEIDWSQFTTEPPAPAAAAGEDVDWSQFSTRPDGDFANVQAGSQSRNATLDTQEPAPAKGGTAGFMDATGPLAQFDRLGQAARDAVMYVPNLLRDTAGAVATMPDYPDIATDPRRQIGIGEGMARTAAERIASLGPIALENVPGPLMAYSLYKKATGQATPVEQYEHAVNQAVGVNDQTMTFRGPGQELLGRMGGEVAAALVPLGPLGEAGSAARLSRSDARAIDAIAGLHGPEAQGAAVADDILSAAKPKPRVRADETGQLREVSPEPVEAPTQTPPTVPVAAMPDQQATQVSADLGLPRARGPEATQAAPPAAAPERPALYHASLAPDITEFRAGHEGMQSDPGVLGRGLYLDGDANRASYYLGPKRKEGTVYSVDAGMENPAVFDSPQAATEFAGELGTTPEAAERIRQKFLDAGHDGVIVRNPENGQVIHAVSFAPEKAVIRERGPVGGQRRSVQEASHAETVRSDPGPTGSGRTHGEAWQSARDRLVTERGPIGDPREAVANGWYVHGRNGRGDLDTGDVLQLTQQMDIAEQYAGKNGSVWMIKPKEGANVLDMTNPADVDRVKTQALNDWRKGQLPWSDDIESALGREATAEDIANAVETEFSPPRIVDSARAYDNDAMKEWLGERFDYPFVKTQDGAVVFSRDNVNAIKREDFEHASRDVQQPPPERSAAGDGEPRAAGAVREQPAQPEALTSVKNATVARERAERGLDEVNYEGGRTHGEAWQSARDRLAKEPEAGISLAHSLVERPRPTTAEETHLLTIDRARLRSEHRVAQAEVRDAMEAGDAAAEISARGRLRALEDDMEVADRASKAAGHEGAIGHAARQFAIRDDGSLAEMVTEAKVRKGEDLTPKQRSKLEEISAKYEAAEKELAELRAAATKRQTRRAPKSVQDEYESLKERLRSIPKEKHTICGAP